MSDATNTDPAAVRADVDGLLKQRTYMDDGFPRWWWSLGSALRAAGWNSLQVDAVMAMLNHGTSLRGHCERLLAENESLRAERDAAPARIKELEAGLAEALKFVKPSVPQLLKEFSDLDGTDPVREQCQEIHDTRDRLAALLAPKPSPEGPK